jgi:hypothetical protein
VGAAVRRPDGFFSFSETPYRQTDFGPTVTICEFSAVCAITYIRKGREGDNRSHPYHPIRVQETPVPPHPEFDEASRRRHRKDCVTLDAWDDVRYWCDSFDCSEGKLRRAVASAGIMAEDVAAFLDEEIPLAYRGE